MRPLRIVRTIRIVAVLSCFALAGAGASLLTDFRLGSATTPPALALEDGPSCLPDQHGHQAVPSPVAAKGTRTPEVADSIGMGGEKLKTILFHDMLVDRIYPSMRGPWSREYLQLEPGDGDKKMWITRYRAEILDAASGSASQEFMCHTNLDLVNSTSSAAPYGATRAQLSISQGQKEIVFPDGYALRIEKNPERQIDVNVMVLNNNYTNINKKLDYKITIGFLDDAIAAERKLEPLGQAAVSASCITQRAPGDPSSKAQCKPATEKHQYDGPNGAKWTGHWLVPPGRQVLVNDVTSVFGLREDTTLHYIWMHIHPYARAMSLRDSTTGEVIWSGKVQNHAEKAAVLSTDFYSSPKGIPVFKDHRYELTTVYDNPTNHDIDAMGALWMYVREKAYVRETN